MRRLIVAVTASAMLALSVSVSSANAAVDKYFGPGTFCCYNSYGSGSNYWTLNQIWRPSGYTIQLWYHNSSGNVGSMLDTFNNPAKDFGPYGYSQGWCYDYADNNYSPVTCQVNT
jgi:hypothetical protein